jgi:hypothetical protein
VGGGLNGVKNRRSLRQDAYCSRRSGNGAGSLNELAPVDVKLLVGDLGASDIGRALDQYGNWPLIPPPL